MHNGLWVQVDGYYGSRMTELLKRNLGCHEPEEEVMFERVITQLPETAVMIEGGAYWAFYSMWFLSGFPRRRAFMIEPDSHNISVGKANLCRNGMSGIFDQAYLGQSAGFSEDQVPIVDLATFVTRHAIEHVHLLHLDIQGAELRALTGALPLIDRQRIDFLFVSTHSEELHKDCSTLISDSSYRILRSIPPSESHSYDGILVAHSPSEVVLG
jgi:hypothetical protein